MSKTDNCLHQRLVIMLGIRSVCVLHSDTKQSKPYSYQERSDEKKKTLQKELHLP